MSKSPSSLATLCRALLRELRRRSNSQPCNAQVWNYVAREVRRTDASSDKRKSEEGKALLAEYVEYLKSSREHMELLSRFQGKGERSTDDAAKLVGLKLPPKV